MFSINGLADGFTLQTTSLDIAIDNVKAHVLTDDYFDNLSDQEFTHAALEWITEV